MEHPTFMLPNNLLFFGVVTATMHFSHHNQILPLLATVLLLLNYGYSKGVPADAACSGLARNDIQTLWLETGKNCEKADDGVLTPSNSLIKSAPNRFKGQCLSDYVSTLMSELEKVVNSCGNKCGQVGRIIGEEGAAVFCELAKIIGHTPRFDGLRDAPNLVCGESYKVRCESSFVSRATNECPKYAKGAAFDSYYRAEANGVCSYKSN